MYVYYTSVDCSIQRCYWRYSNAAFERCNQR